MSEIEHPLKEALDLKERFGADKFDKLKTMTVDTMETMLADLKASVERGDREEAMRHAHSFKSSAGNYGADALSSKAAELEAKFKESIPDDIEPDMIVMEILVEDFLAILKVL